MMLMVGCFQHRETMTSQIKWVPRIQIVVENMIIHQVELFTVEKLSDMIQNTRYYN